MMIWPRQPCVACVYVVVTLLAAGCNDIKPSDAGPDGDQDVGPDCDHDVRPDSDHEADADVGPICEGSGETRDGDRCVCDEDCQDLAFCDVEALYGWPGGLCLRLCDLEEVGECPGVAICADILEEGEVSEGIGVCMPWCADLSDCDIGRTCSANVCHPLCQAHEDCLSGHCDADLGLCTDGSPTEGAGLMEPCLRDEDCLSWRCGVQSRCVSFCDLDRDGCPTGSRCVPNGLELDEVGVCRPECLDNDTCALEGLDCSYAGYPPGATACFELSGDLSCQGRTTENPDEQPCGCNDDCGPGALCLDEATYGWPQSRCIRYCIRGIEGQCAPGFICNTRSSVNAVCWLECSAHEDCGLGYVCDVETSTCHYACESDDECLNTRCDLQTGLCQRTSTEGLPMGAPCSNDDECRSDDCQVIRSYSQCTRRCLFSEQRCPEDSLCASPDVLGLGFCLRSCETPADCDHVGASCVPTDTGLPDHCE